MNEIEQLPQQQVWGLRLFWWLCLWKLCILCILPTLKLPSHLNDHELNEIQIDP